MGSVRNWSILKNFIGAYNINKIANNAYFNPEGIIGNRLRCSFHWLSISVSTSQPRHTPTKAIVIGSLSLHSGSGPGLLNNSGYFVQ